MRGDDYNQSEMFCYLSCEEMVPENHPLRKVKEQTDECLKSISRKFTPLYSELGRPSIAPEKLLRALLLQVLYSIRSERLLMEQLRYNFLYRWFIGLNMEEKVWDASVFGKNRDRLLEGEIAAAFLDAVWKQARENGLLSDEHFSVDGTLIEAWASQKSFQRKDDPPEQGSGARGKMRLNDVCASRTDPEARKFKKSFHGEAKLCHLGHVLMDNRHGLVADVCVSIANTGEERTAATRMLKRTRRKLGKRGRLTVGGDKGYDDRKFVTEMRQMQITPHVAQFENRSSSIDARTTRHAGYEQSRNRRARIEQIFSWLKNIGMLRKTRHRGHRKLEWLLTLALSGYNLIRMRNLALQPA